MPVVSVSLDDELLEKIEKLKSEIGFSGRSEIFRAALRSFIEEKKNLEDLEGNISCVMVVTHQEEADLDIHEYQDLITSQLHNHNSEGRCFQTFVLEGEAKQIVGLKQEFEKVREVLDVNLIRL